MVKNLVHLYADSTGDCELARRYLEGVGIDFMEFYSKALGAENHQPDRISFGTGTMNFNLGSQVFPSLIVSSSVTGYLHPSFQGVKNYIRDGLSEELFDPVSWFNQAEEFYVGSVENAPQEIRDVLSQHPHKAWDRVFGWRVGKLEELAQRQNEQGIIIDEQTKTILFPDEIELLRRGERIVTVDASVMVDIAYQVYSPKKVGSEIEVFGVYVSMID